MLLGRIGRPLRGLSSSYRLMKIGINATCFNHRPSGARQRFQGIYGALFRQMPTTRFEIFEPRDCRVASWFEGLDNVVAVPSPLPSQGRLERLARGFFYWDRAFSLRRLSLFEGSNLPFVRPKNTPGLLTIHDVRNSFETLGWVGKKFSEWIMRDSIRRASHVITVSETMRQEILAVDDSRPVSVIYNGIDPTPFQAITQEETDSLKIRFSLPSEFLLSVGHFEPRKSYETLIEAVAKGRSGVPLIIVGNDNGTRADIESQIHSWKLGAKVQILSNVSDQDLRSLYRLSRLVVFPSRYEGFGIPILEAMAAGTPLVTSDIPVFKEITQSQGLYFPCGDPSALASAIETGLGSEGERRRLVDYGRERLRDFSFEELARQVESVYRKTS